MSVLAATNGGPVARSSAHSSIQGMQASALRPCVSCATNRVHLLEPSRLADAMRTAAVYTTPAQLRSAERVVSRASQSDIFKTDRSLQVKLMLAKSSQKLDFSSCDLYEVPEEVFELEDLEVRVGVAEGEQPCACASSCVMRAAKKKLLF